MQEMRKACTYIQKEKECVIAGIKAKLEMAGKDQQLPSHRKGLRIFLLITGTPNNKSYRSISNGFA